MSLLHESGVRSRLWMNGMAAQVGPRFHVLGSEAGYTKWGLDSQEPALAAGMSPSDPAYGVEPQDSWGVLGIDGAAAPVPAERGAIPGSTRSSPRPSAGRAACRSTLPSPCEVLKIIEKIHAFA